MKPGQIELNEFEIAILERISKDEPSIGPLIPKLRVLSREFTGVGSYTTMRCNDSAPSLGNHKISLRSIILMPNVPAGMGAVLFCENGKPKVLETFTFGNDHWYGVFEGFTIEEAA